MPEERKETPKAGVAVVTLLDGKTLEIPVDRKWKCEKIFDAVCEHLDLLEKDYFGLNYFDKAGRRTWLDLDKRIGKVLKGEDWNLNFEVKFYPKEPSQLQEDFTRYLLCLQVRNDILSGKLPCSFVVQAMLGSYLVQSQLGDFNAEDTPDASYLAGFKFAPVHAEGIEERVMALHKNHKGQTPAEAEQHYLENAKKLSLYGVDMYPAKDSEGVDIQLGICSTGILVYQGMLRINRFAWPKILKISYRRNNFYIKIRPGEFEQYEQTVGFKLDSSRSAKNLWKVCVDQHTFFRLMSADVSKRPSVLFPRLGSLYRWQRKTQVEVMGTLPQRNSQNFTRSLSLRPLNSRSLEGLRENAEMIDAQKRHTMSHPPQRSPGKEKIPAGAVPVLPPTPIKKKEKDHTTNGLSPNEDDKENRTLSVDNDATSKDTPKSADKPTKQTTAEGLAGLFAVGSKDKKKDSKKSSSKNEKIALAESDPSYQQQQQTKSPTKSEKLSVFSSKTSKKDSKKPQSDKNESLDTKNTENEGEKPSTDTNPYTKVYEYTVSEEEEGNKSKNIEGFSYEADKVSPKRSSQIENTSPKSPGRTGTATAFNYAPGESKKIEEASNTASKKSLLSLFGKKSSTKTDETSPPDKTSSETTSKTQKTTSSLFGKKTSTENLDDKPSKLNKNDESPEKLTSEADKTSKSSSLAGGEKSKKSQKSIFGLKSPLGSSDEKKTKKDDSPDKSTLESDKGQKSVTPEGDGKTKKSLRATFLGKKTSTDNLDEKKRDSSQKSTPEKSEDSSPEGKNIDKTTSSEGDKSKKSSKSLFGKFTSPESTGKKTDGDKSSKKSKSGETDSKSDTEKSKKAKSGETDSKTDTDKSKKSKSGETDSKTTDADKSKKSKSGETNSKTDTDKSSKKSKSGEADSKTDTEKSKKSKSGEADSKTDTDKSLKKSKSPESDSKTDKKKSKADKKSIKKSDEISENVPKSSSLTQDFLTAERNNLSGVDDSLSSIGSGGQELSLRSEPEDGGKSGPKIVKTTTKSKIVGSGGTLTQNVEESIEDINTGQVTRSTLQNTAEGLDEMSGSGGGSPYVLATAVTTRTATTLEDLGTNAKTSQVEEKTVAQSTKTIGQRQEQRVVHQELRATTVVNDSSLKRSGSESSVSSDDSGTNIDADSSGTYFIENQSKGPIVETERVVWTAAGPREGHQATTELGGGGGGGQLVAGDEAGGAPPNPFGLPGAVVTSQTITSKTRTVETLTYKTEKDGVVETRVEQKITIQSDGDPVDHEKALNEAIQEATAMNPDMRVEKIEIQQEAVP